MGKVSGWIGDGDQMSALTAIIAAIQRSHATAHEVTLESLRRAILGGLLPPGTRLRQEELAEVFGSRSRIPVREALRVLEYEGLVGSEPHRGFRVIALDAQQIEEIYELRTVLETHALRVAIPLLTDGDLQELQGLYTQMATEADPNVAFELREGFYMRLYAVTGRPRLVALISGLRQEVTGSLRRRLVQHSPRHHEILFDAIQRGDAEVAAAELASHYRKVAGLIRRLLREDRGELTTDRDSTPHG